MKAERLDDHRLLGDFIGHAPKAVFAVKESFLLQRFDILKDLFRIGGGHFGVFRGDLLHDLFLRRFFIAADDVVGHFIHFVDGAGVGIENDMKTVFFK